MDYSEKYNQIKSVRMIKFLITSVFLCFNISAANLPETSMPKFSNPMRQSINDDPLPLTHVGIDMSVQPSIGLPISASGDGAHELALIPSTRRESLAITPPARRLCPPCLGCPWLTRSQTLGGINILSLVSNGLLLGSAVYILSHNASMINFLFLGLISLMNATDRPLCWDRSYDSDRDLSLFLEPIRSCVQRNTCSIVTFGYVSQSFASLLFVIAAFTNQPPVVYGGLLLLAIRMAFETTEFVIYCRRGRVS